MRQFRLFFGVIALTGVAASALLPSAGHAQSEKPVAALGRVAAIGEISEGEQKIIGNRLTRFLARKYELISQQEYARAEEAAFEALDEQQCTEENCVRFIQDFLQIENLFILQIIREQELTQLTLTLFRIDTRAVAEDICLNCGILQLYGKVEQLVDELIGGAPQVVAPLPVPPPALAPPPVGTLQLTGWTPEHRLTVDGDPATPDDQGRLELEPGQHRVAISREGFLDRQQRALIAEGRTTRLDAALEPERPHFGQGLATPALRRAPPARLDAALEPERPHFGQGLATPRPRAR